MEVPDTLFEDLEAVVFGRGKHSVDVQTAHEMATNDGYTILDVRTPMERRQGHPPGSEHIVLDGIPRFMGSLEGKRVLTICRSGNRSDHAAKYLRSQGIDAINVRGGMIAWVRAGLPVKTGR